MTRTTHCGGWVTYRLSISNIRFIIDRNVNRIRNNWLHCDDYFLIISSLLLIFRGLIAFLVVSSLQSIWLLISVFGYFGLFILQRIAIISLCSWLLVMLLFDSLILFGISLLILFKWYLNIVIPFLRFAIFPNKFAPFVIASINNYVNINVPLFLYHIWQGYWNMLFGWFIVFNSRSMLAETFFFFYHTLRSNCFNISTWRFLSNWTSLCVCPRYLLVIH